MSKTAICYVTDKGYLFPSLLSAVQARAHAPRAADDIYIFVTMCDDEAFAIFQSVGREEGIHVERMSQGSLDLLNDVSQFGGDSLSGKIPLSSFGRLFLDLELPKGVYDHVFYIDGDTQIIADLTPMLEFPVPDGGVVACRDYFSLMRHADEEWVRTRIMNWRKLNLPEEALPRYFNGGVMKFRMADFPDIRAAAMQAWSDGADRFVAHDQDALNVCLHDKTALASIRWNFPRFMLGLPVEEELKPAIVHFVSHPKPWHGRFPPFTDKWVAPYEEIVARHPRLAPYRPTLDIPHRAVYTWRALKIHVANILSGGRRQDFDASECSAGEI